MKILVLGIGNPILSDDGVGIHVARRFKEIIKNDSTINIMIDEASAGGLVLLDMILGYDTVILIDAIKTENGQIGEIYKYGIDDFAETLHVSSPHDVNFATAIEIGRKNMPEKMPKIIVIYAIEVKNVDVFSEEMTPEVKEVIPKVAKMVLLDLREMIK